MGMPIYGEQGQDMEALVEKDKKSLLFIKIGLTSRTLVSLVWRNVLKVLL